MPVKSNSRSSRRAGARGGRTPHIIFGSHWGFFYERVHHHRKPDRPSSADLGWHRSDRRLHGTQPQGAIHRWLDRRRLSAPLVGGGATIDRVLCRNAARIRFAAAAAGHTLPATRVARIDRNTLWRDLELWRAGQENRQAQRLACRGTRERAQSHLDPGALPPGDRCRWVSDRVRRGPRSQALAAGPRGPAPRPAGESQSADAAPTLYISGRVMVNIAPPPSARLAA